VLLADLAIEATEVLFYFFILLLYNVLESAKGRCSHMSEVVNATVMGFVSIVEAYPDEYILVRIVEIDHNNGRATGIAIYTASSYDELTAYAKNEGIINETIILSGENLTPVLGGLI